MARRMAFSSSAHLTVLACSITSSPLKTDIPSSAKRDDAVRIDLVHGDPPVAAAMSPHQIGDFRRPEPRPLGRVLACLVVEPGLAVADLVDRVEMPGEVLAIVKIPKDHRAFGGDEGVAHGVVRAPELHVGGIGRVADVERVVDDDAGEIALHQLGTDAREAVAPRHGHVGRVQPERRPFTLRQLAIADDVLVEARRLLHRIARQRLARGAFAGMLGKPERRDLAPLAGEGRARWMKDSGHAAP